MKVIERRKCDGTIHILVQLADSAVVSLEDLRSEAVRIREQIIISVTLVRMGALPELE